MARISLRSIGAHKVRLFLTVLAVVLGTAFIAGSLMFTASLSKTFDSIVDAQMKEVDAVVSVTPPSSESGPSASGEEGGQPMASQPNATLKAADIDALTKMPEVGRMNLADQTQAVIATADGETINTGGAPLVVTPFYTGSESVMGSNELTEGRKAKGQDEVVINSEAAESHNIGVGDSLTIVTNSGRTDVKVTGIYKAETATGGFIGIGVEPSVFGKKYKPGQPSIVYVSAAEGTSQDQLLSAVKAKFPQYYAMTGEDVSAEVSKEIGKALSFVTYFLVAFGLVGLLVGTFIIANTFSMIVAQRMREFALLRAIGVSRKQLTSSVIFEAFVVGVIGSALGVIAGMGLVKVIYAILEAVGAGLPAGGIGLTVQSVVLPLILGVIVTIISAWAPARRAGAVSPVAAMRSGDATSSNSLKTRTIIGVSGVIIGAVCAIAGANLGEWETKPRAILVGVGALLVILGAFLASPAVSRVVVPIIGRGIGFPFGSVGVLARKNTQRNPRRTATTAFALTLGLALVAAIGMLGASMKASVASVTESTVKADYVASAPSNSGFPLPYEAIGAVRKAEGVESTLAMGVAPLMVDGVGGQPGMPMGRFFDGDPNKSIEMTTVEGKTDLSEPGFIADKEAAEKHGWVVGKEYPLLAGKRSAGGAKAKLLGTYESNRVLGTYMLSQSAVLEASGRKADDIPPGEVMGIMVNGKPGTDPEQLKSSLEDATKDFLVIQILTPQEFSGQAAVMVDQMLNILYAMLALAIIVAILGIINTLALNVIERRQEVGMLRAIGTMRGQIRRMITLEAVQIAVYGALLGVVIGLGLGWAFIKVLAGEGLETVEVPVGQLVIMVFASALVGVLAAIWPAIKASKTPPLEAIAD